MASQIQAIQVKISKVLNDDKSFLSPYLSLIEEKTGVERTKLAYGAAAFIAVYLVFGYGGQLVCNFIGFAYPAYSSMKALETQQKEDDTKWLTYWVVFAWFSLIEYFADFIVGWIPIYWLIKCAFLIWCFLPIQSNGSVVIYHNYIRPHFLQNQGRMDNLINDITSQARSKITGVGKTE